MTHSAAVVSAVVARIQVLLPHAKLTAEPGPGHEIRFEEGSVTQADVAALVFNTLTRLQYPSYWTPQVVYLYTPDLGTKAGTWVINFRDSEFWF